MTSKAEVNGSFLTTVNRPQSIPTTMNAVSLSATKNQSLGDAAAVRACDYRNPQLQIRSVPVPRPGPGEVLLRVLSISVCGSDYHAVSCDRNGNLGSSVPSQGLEHGRILGHEFTGQVVAASADVDQFTHGDLVTGDSVLCCRGADCEECRHHLHNHCTNAVLNGFERDGVFAEFACLPAAALYSINGLTDHYGDEAQVVGTQAEPLGVAAKAISESLEISRRAWDKSLLIFGAGPIGYYCALVARARGFGPITIVEPNPSRQQWATSVSENVFCPTTFTRNIAKGSQERKYSLVLECCGSAPIERLPALVQPGGVLTLLARNDQQMRIDTDTLVTHGISVTGTRGHVGYVAEMISMLEAGTLDPRPFITQHLKGMDQLASWLRHPNRFLDEGKVVCEIGELHGRRSKKELR